MLLPIKVDKRMALIVEGGCPEPCSDRTLRTMFEDRKTIPISIVRGPGGERVPPRERGRAGPIAI